MIRPELRALAARNAEALVLLAAMAAGLLLLATNMRPLLWPGALAGLVLTAAAGLALLAHLLRRRVAARGDAPGVVQVVEGRVAYFAPGEGGAVVDLSALVRLQVAPGGTAWVLTREDGPPVTIPTGARGADALVDAFAALPGFRLDRALAAMAAGADTPSTVWQRRAAPGVLASPDAWR